MQQPSGKNAPPVSLQALTLPASGPLLGKWLSEAEKRVKS